VAIKGQDKVIDKVEDEVWDKVEHTPTQTRPGNGKVADSNNGADEPGTRL
jgi:hypothetical protein